MSASEHTSEYRISLVTHIVRAYVASNSVPAGELPGLIGAVNSTLVAIASGKTAAGPDEEVAKPTPAQVRKSVGPDGIVSFLDGRSYKTLKRHLTTHGLTPQRYRERFGLPRDYPMVCSSYAAQRSELAKKFGLGRAGATKEREDAAPAAKESPSKAKAGPKARKAA